jgi:hypothetical protein
LTFSGNRELFLTKNCTDTGFENTSLRKSHGRMAEAKRHYINVYNSWVRVFLGTAWRVGDIGVKRNTPPFGIITP